MLRCFIIDDELHAISILSNFIKDNPGLDLVGFSQAPMQAMNDIVENKIQTDILFLDINMPSISGLNVARLVTSYTKVIITSAFSNFGFEAFEADVYDYLLKPISQEKFLQSINKVKKMMQVSMAAGTEENTSYFYVKSDNKGKLLKVKTEDIIYIEAALNYVMIHVNNPQKQQLTYISMNEILDYLPKNFKRVHKSYIINTEKIVNISGNNLQLEDKTILPLGPSYRVPFFDFMDEKIIKPKKT